MYSLEVVRGVTPKTALFSGSFFFFFFFCLRYTVTFAWIRKSPDLVHEDREDGDIPVQRHLCQKLGQVIAALDAEVRPNGWNSNNVVWQVRLWVLRGRSQNLFNTAAG